MKITLLFITLCVMVLPLFANSEEKMHVGLFDSVTVYRPASGTIQQVVLFISGDGGWNQGVVSMARELTKKDALVIGVNITTYLKNVQKQSEKCIYPAADFEMLSKLVQKKLDLPQYILPLLVGYSSGATLAYAIIAQSPVNTFKGAISMGFGPDMPLSKPACEGAGLHAVPGKKGKGVIFLPRENMVTPWIVLHGDADQVCSLSTAKAFVARVAHSRIVVLPKVGHGYSVEKNWLPQFLTACDEMVAMPDPLANQKALNKEVQNVSLVNVDDMPIIEVPAGGNGKDLFAIVLSGDGGWAGIDKDIAGGLSQKGINVAGFNSLQYFWKARTPDETAKNIERIINHYSLLWKKSKVILIGYSFGADVLPFVVSRLSEEQKATIAQVVFLGLSENAEFQFHVTGWIGSVSKEALPTLPEIKKLKGLPMLYVYGTEETDNVSAKVSPLGVTTSALAGGHHFGGKYDVIVEKILGAITAQ